MSIIEKGSTIDEALTKAMIELGVSSDNIEYEIISEGSNGFLGIGAKPFEIEVWKKGEKPTNKEKLKDNTKQEEIKVKIKETKEEVKKEGLNEKEKGVFEFNSYKHKQEEIKEMTRDPQEVIENTKKFLEPIFKGIGICPEIEADINKKENTIVLNFKGDNMGIIIGKHGVTIDALQHLVNLNANKGEKDKVRIRIDSENYRKKRQDTLERLARSVAQSVKKTKRKVALEPMSAYERRIIHSTLQSERNIETYSEGEDRYRHVVVKYRR
ncbi:MAG: RNA-binding cell elongation regulator Jag/EloR [Eubacteriales bacterium]|nr:RNA-binding cell elongation regulator Jag/EloR [Eubacteriales bacterium]